MITETDWTDEQKDCVICGERMILVGGGWVCINPECPSNGHVIK